MMLLVKDRVPVLTKELLSVRDTEGVRVVEVHRLRVMLAVKDRVRVLQKEALLIAEEVWPSQGSIQNNIHKRKTNIVL